MDVAYHILFQTSFIFFSTFRQCDLKVLYLNKTKLMIGMIHTWNILREVLKCYITYPLSRLNVQKITYCV